MPVPVRVMVRAGARFMRHEGDVMAGYVAYSVLLAMFPFLIFCVSLAGVLIGPAQSVEAVDFLFEMLPSHVAQTLAPVVNEVVSRSSRGVVTVSALVAIWTASNGVEAFRISLDRAYEVRSPRSYVMRRLMAVSVVLLGTLTFVVLGLAIVAGPLLIRLVESGLDTSIPGVVSVVRYVVGIVVLLFFLMVLHRRLATSSSRPRRLWPGVLVSAALWLVGALAFSAYLDYAPSYTVTYGTLAGVIITMLFLYLTGIVFIFGAEVNASLEASREDGPAVAGE
ncbi:YihY/virulence factor BrkB family protein [Oceanicella sp. SM1341]|uniref:YihY/virulence factor BrkB family protein n=1 Tax=Oceanicella sp. SM1341 TaxID=1548889 RepID=UPI000E46F5C2|nr:YihY/virulence factor BrkB family protein [Oceanicella sp. SM1341]